jgi:hypothetical protein
MIIQPGNLDGATITWLFLGRSSWFVVLLGSLELIAGAMLLFRKTMLFGAVILFPILLAICLVNHAYHFLPHMRVLTSVLLLTNLLLLLRVYKPFLSFVKGEWTEQKFGVFELVVNVLLIGAVLGLIVINFTA